MRALAFGFALALVAAPAAAQPAVDARWSGWLGCWELVTDDERNDGPAPAAAAIDRVLGIGTGLPEFDARAASSSRPRLCVTPADEGGVTLTTLAAGAVVLEQTLVADGREHAMAGECAGTQRAEWSRDGSRLFSHAEVTCAGDGPRTITGLTLIAPDGSWLDIEAVHAGSRDSLRVRRYRRADERAAGARLLAGSRLTLADVEEATRQVPPAVVEAALVETEAAFNLKARDITTLADAGVPERVIDLMVALSFPQTFIVERRASPGGGGLGPFSGGLDPFSLSMYDSWRYLYSPFAYASPRYYTYTDGGLFFPGSIVVVGGGSTVNPGPPPTLSGPAVAINDLGYTRVRQREAEPGTSARPRSTSTMTGDGRVVSTGPSSTSGASSGSSDGGGGGGSASPEGYSGGGGSGGSGRTAVPR